VGVLIPSPRVTDSETQNLVFRRRCFFFFFCFSVVFQNKLWWWLQISVFFQFNFWFAVPSQFRLWQMATPLGTVESPTIYLDVQNWCGFFFIFFLPLPFLIFLSLFDMWNYCMCMFFFILVFGIIARCGFGYTLYSPFTHTFCSLYEWGFIPGSELLRIRGDCVAVPQWMYFPSGHCENPN